MLLSTINIAYYQALMAGMREAIAGGTFADFRAGTTGRLGAGGYLRPLYAGRHCLARAASLKPCPMNIRPDFLAHRRKPTFKLPPGATDAHCHVFGPAAKFPYAPSRRYTPEDAPKEMLAALHAHLGVERTVIVQASCHGSDNRAMLDAIADDPANIKGVCIVDNSFGDAEYKTLHDGGVRGARFNFVKHLGGTPDMDLFHRTVDRIKEMGWHIVLHLDAPEHHSAVGHDPHAAAALRHRPYGPGAGQGRRRPAAAQGAA